MTIISPISPIRYFKRYLSISLVLFSVCNSYGYDSLTTALNLYQSTQFQKALPFFLSLSRKYEKANEIEKYALCQLKIDDMIRVYGGPHIGLAILEKSEQLLKASLEPPSEVLCETLLMKADCLYDIGNYEAFRKMIDESEKNRKLLRSNDDNIPAKEFMYRARYYQEVHARRDSVEYWVNESLRLAKKYPIKFKYLIPRIYTLFGYHIHLINGRYYNDRVKFFQVMNTSRAYFDSAFHALQRNPIMDSITLSLTYHKLANSFNNESGATQSIETHKKAIAYYNKSIAIVKKFGSPTELALKDWVMAVAYGRFRNRDSTLRIYQRGMEKLLPGYHPKSIRDIPPVARSFNDKLFNTFPFHMSSQFQDRYKEHGSIEDLISAYRYGIYCIKSYQYLVLQTESDEETMYGFYLYIEGYHQSLAHITHELIRVTKDKKYLIEAYPFLISSKYAFLNRNDSDTELRENNEDIMERELTQVKSTLERGGQDSTIKTFIDGLVPNSKGEFKKKADKAINVKSRYDSVALVNVQSRIADDRTAILDIYFAGRTVEIVAITKYEVDIKSYIGHLDIYPKVRKLRRDMLKLKPAEYGKLSHAVYIQFLDSALRELPTSVNKLIICPDSWLTQIPWGALVFDTAQSKPLSFKTLRYLHTKYQIQIIPTIKTIYKEAKTFEDDFVGLASDFTGSNRFSALPFSSQLVKKVSKDFDGSVETDFPTRPISSKIFHVATHIKADSLRPFLSTLYLSDTDSVLLSNVAPTKDNIGLAVLSACESGGNSFYGGEGTIGFARSFYRKGASSVLLTLWSVDDKATADILAEFYEQVQSGKPLDISLSEAQRKFLENAPTDELANPYYWAGLQLTGKADPLFETNFYHTWSFAAGAVVLIFTGLFFYRKNGRSFKRS